MKDNCGFGITEGIYIDFNGFHYYHIKKTPEGFLIREAKEEQYSPLVKESFAAGLIRVNRQDELIALINSVEKASLEKLVAQSQPKCTVDDDAMIGDLMGRASHPLPGDD